MLRLRIIGRVGLGAGMFLLGLGALFAVGAAAIAGDWWLAREPWIGIGLTALVVGLATIGAFGLLLNIIEPIGRLRLFALPPAVLAAFVWLTTYLAPASGACCEQPERDIRTMLYSIPEALVLLTLATLAMLVPLAVARRRGEHLKAASR